MRHAFDGIQKVPHPEEATTVAVSKDALRCASPISISSGVPAMTELKGYHAHVYYNPATRPVAEGLRDTIISKFAVEPGAFSDEPRGPHPISQFAVIFRIEEFQKIVPWLMLNREGLDVLVHPLTESSYDDHSKNALWLGTPVPMRLEVLRPTYRTELLPTAAA
jgi:aromatic ring-cleaving dioxygenase